MPPPKFPKFTTSEASLTRYHIKVNGIVRLYTCILKFNKGLLQND